MQYCNWVKIKLFVSISFSIIASLRICDLHIFEMGRYQMESKPILGEIKTKYIIDTTELNGLRETGVSLIWKDICATAKNAKNKCDKQEKFILNKGL